MKIEKYINSQDEVIKEIEKETYYWDVIKSSWKVNLCVWSIEYDKYGNNNVETPLYIYLETDGRHPEVIDCAWVQSVGDFEIEKLKHREALNDFKNDIYKILKNNFKNVKIVDHND